jgi:uncharacterized membrane protein
LVTVWYIGLSFPILFSSSEFIVLTPLIKKAYSNVCHQESYKLITIGGNQFLVCARCLGIYTGVLIFSFISIFLKIIPNHIIKLIIISIVMIFADILFYTTGLYGYSKYIAFGTGLFSGSVTFIYILNEFDNYLLTIILPDEK